MGLMGRGRVLLDQWAPMSYKRQLAGPSQGTGPRGFGSSWMPPADRRRITAYLVLRAYVSNVARELLVDDAVGAGDRREYGDADLLVQSALSALLGDEQTITVEGADDHNPNLPEDAPKDVKALSDDAREAWERQEWLRDWAVKVRLRLKLVEAEGNAVTLGDGVYLLSWSPAKRRPLLRVYDPGFYFPSLTVADEDDYPERVHLAWEEADPDTGQPRWLRRVTYELGPIVGQTELDMTVLGRLRRMISLSDTGAVTLQPGDLDLGDGNIGRRYPWQESDEEPSTTTCYLTDARWELNDVESDAVDALSMAKATIMFGEPDENGEQQLLDRLDLRIDFVPVVHSPNTYTGSAHFGESVLSKVLQVLDDLSSTDTDLQAASGTTGSPPIGVSGTNIPKSKDGLSVDLTMEPGVVWGLGEDGSIHTVDTSPALAALSTLSDRLKERASETSRLPSAVLGRVKPNEVPSGLALLIGFAPYRSLIEFMRLMRKEKHPLILKFAQRLAIAGGELEAGKEMPAEIMLGPYLPNDLDAVIERASKMLTGGIASLETVVAMLVDAGVPIEDVQEEVLKIERRAFDLALKLADATGDNAAVREFLHMKEQAPVPPLPPPPLPGAPVVPPPPVPPEPQPPV